MQEEFLRELTHPGEGDGRQPKHHGTDNRCQAVMDNGQMFVG